MFRRCLAAPHCHSGAFMSTEVSVNDHVVATAHGVFKTVRDRTDAGRKND
jgi:hypothetical protein